MTASRPIAMLLAAVLALGAAACGNEEQEKETYQSENAQVAETEGIYLEVGEAKYQVQISRQLNPLLVEDKDYFEGVSESDLDLAKDELWFGVWMRVENESDDALPLATRFEISDTQENQYVPVTIGEPNPFAYRGGKLEGQKLYPLPDSPAGERPPYASLILFKLKRFSLDNRPLELHIDDPQGGPGATVNLDV